MSVHAFSTEGSRARLTIRRNLDWAGLPDISTALEGLSGAIKELTVDLGALDRLDNAGLGILLMLRHKAAEQGVSVTVVTRSEAVVHALAASRLDRIFRVERPAAGGEAEMQVEELPL